eukprot:6202049-Pleurochrysis_carterae.AAC.5
MQTADGRKTNLHIAALSTVSSIRTIRDREAASQLQEQTICTSIAHPHGIQRLRKKSLHLKVSKSMYNETIYVL